VTRLHSEVTGPDTAPVLVLGPSLGTALGLFDAQVAALSGDWRIVRFDLPGHGGSAPPSSTCTVPGIAADVLALLDELGVERFHYAGVSLGGAVGQQLAVDSGARLRSLTVCASAARFPDPSSWTARAATVREEGTQALVASRTGTWWTAEFEQLAPQEVERLLDMLRATSSEGYAACCEAISTFDVRHELGRITAPTLVLAGADDPATPVPVLRQIADAVPAARLVVLRDAAHLPNVQQPAQVNRALAEHLRRAS
jgi:3-oxoadipate enol-lactonase